VEQTQELLLTLEMLMRKSILKILTSLHKTIKVIIAYNSFVPFKVVNCKVALCCVTLHVTFCFSLESGTNDNSESQVSGPLAALKSSK